MTGSQLLALLRKLAEPASAPYDELDTRRVVHQFLNRSDIPFEVDRFGNTVARIRHGRPRQLVAYVAHLDHPAFRVASVKKTRVQCQAEGGLPARGIRGASVVFPKTVHGPITGTVRSVKTEKRGERPRVVSAVITVNNGQPLPETGDFAIFQLPPLQRAGNRLRLRAADDLAGTCAILATLEHLARQPEAVDAVGVFTRAEEVGFHGSIALAIERRLPPSAFVVSVECSQARTPIQIGQGPVVRVGDRTGPFDPKVSALLKGAAEALAPKKLTYQRALMDGGSCEATAFAAFGFRVGGIALPLGNYHNQGSRTIALEEIDLRDLQGAVQLMVGAACRAAAGTDDLALLRNELIRSSDAGRNRLEENPSSPLSLD